MHKATSPTPFTNGSANRKLRAGGFALCLTLTAAFATPLAAADDDAKPVTGQPVSARDVAMTPISDLNLEKDDIPPLLLEAQKDPYSTAGLKRCSQYVSEVEALDALLGPDFDVATAEQRGMSVGSVAQSVVGSLIPFRGVIRELSGANKHERAFRDAILAGVMRRAFLKGMGLKLGCKYPARPADEATKARYAAEAAKAAEEAKKKKGD